MFIARWAIVLAILYFFYRIAKWALLPSGKTAEPLPSRQMPVKTEDLVEDPYCHTYLPQSEAYKASIAGEIVYFCSEKCYRQFLEHNKSSTTE